MLSTSEMFVVKTMLSGFAQTGSYPQSLAYSSNVLARDLMCVQRADVATPTARLAWTNLGFPPVMVH